MSTPAAFFTAAGVVSVLCILVLLWWAWKAKEATPGADPAPDPQPDPRWGIDVALYDECALILSLPLYGTGDHTTTNPTGDQT